MVRLFTTILFILPMALACPQVAAAMPIEEPGTMVVQAEPVGEIGVKVSGQSVRVTNANGKTLEVFSITGAKVATVAIDANDKTVSLNLNRGWYILKVGNVTRKIAIR